VAESDESLAAACAAGNPKAWTALIDRFGGVVCGTIRNVLGRYGLAGRQELVDDICQRVFTDLWEKRRLEGLREKSLVRPLLVNLAVWRAVDGARDLLKEKGRTVAAETNGAPDVLADRPAPGPDPRERARRRELEAIVERELEALPSREAYILRLSAREGLTHRQIAELLGMPRDTVSTVVRRARGRIRASLVEKGFLEW
jgi:RNA polymerase sigma-70 factor (ECF subfamily)